MSDILQRYQACAQRIWRMFPSDPLPADCPAHFYIERLEAILDRGLLAPSDDNPAGSFKDDDK